jgi:transposase
MDRYMGLDVHVQSCTLAVMSSTGKHLQEQVLETQGKVLVEAVSGIAGRRHLCVEEGELSAWLYELLEPYVEQLVVVQPPLRQGTKSDAIDAWWLAEQLRVGAACKRVYKPPQRFSALREAARGYQIAVQEMVRAKNRLNALYRSRGITGGGEAIYEATKRASWLDRLPAAHRALGEQLSEQLDARVASHERAEAWLLCEARKLPEGGRLMSVPGLGPIRAAQVVAAVVAPERFRTKQQFWSYCGLGLVTRSSSDWTKDDSTQRWVRRSTRQPRGLNRNRHPVLKAVFKGAALTVISSMPRHPLHEAYQRQVAAGCKPHLARLTLARRLAAATLAVWKHKEEYNAAKHCSRAA